MVLAYGLADPDFLRFHQEVGDVGVLLLLAVRVWVLGVVVSAQRVPEAAGLVDCLARFVALLLRVSVREMVCSHLRSEGGDQFAQGVLLGSRIYV
jgi:hypothetical protein